jgi:hypothetical protein
MSDVEYAPDFVVEPAIPKFKVRPFTTPQIEAMEELLTFGIPAGIVRPSTSPYLNNLVFVTKPDQTLRPCLHAKVINSASKKKKFWRVPLINELIEWIGDARVKSFLDNLSGYWQVAIAEAYRKNFAFRTHRGTFEFCVLVMGADDGVFFYQWTMEEAFAEFLHECIWMMSV